MLPEIPMSIVEILGRRFSLFGGGYLRLAPQRLIQWGINRLRNSNQPLIVYIHPREIDPDHPRLPLSLVRQFKSYVNLKSTMPKLRWLCDSYSFCTMLELVENWVKSFHYDKYETIPVVGLPKRQTEGMPAVVPAFKAQGAHTA